MKLFKLYFTPILFILFFSPISSADIRLVGADKEPGEPTVLGHRLSLNTQLSGKFTLNKNSQINLISASIVGAGSLLVSIYSNSELTSLPTNLIYNSSVEITAATFNGLSNFELAPIQLEKGTYWIVIEPITIIDDITSYYNSAFEPLTQYAINFNNTYWEFTKDQLFSLVIEGHPTGQIINKK